MELIWNSLELIWNSLELIGNRPNTIPDVLPHDADECAELPQEVVHLAVLGLADRLVLVLDVDLLDDGADHLNHAGDDLRDVGHGLDPERPEADILFLKHACSILKQSSNPVWGFSMMEKVRLCPAGPTENWLFPEPHTG